MGDVKALLKLATHQRGSGERGCKWTEEKIQARLWDLNKTCFSQHRKGTESQRATNSLKPKPARIQEAPSHPEHKAEGPGTLEGPVMTPPGLPERLQLGSPVLCHCGLRSGHQHR